MTMFRRRVTQLVTGLTQGLTAGLAAGLFGLVLTPEAQAQNLTEARRIEQSFRPAASAALRLDVSFGSVSVHGEDRDDIAVEITLSCPTGRDQAVCQKRAERLVLEARNRSKHLAVRLRRTPRARALGIRSSMTVRVPRDQGLEIDVRAGDVEVNGMQSHVEIDVGTGDTTLFFPQERVEYVKADVGFGRANLWLADESNIQGTGWPRSFTWRAEGNKRVEIDVGTGDVSVRLTN